MGWLREVLASHPLGLALLHGQAFFVLGLSILFLTRRAVRLELARELAPLAAFGFCEALTAWSRGWLGPSGVSALWLAWLRLFLLGVGYAFLVAFGLQVYLSSERRYWDRWKLALGLFALWLIGLGAARLLGASAERIRLIGEIAARYGLALPGGMLGARGFRRETYRTIEPGRLPLVKFPMRITGLALAAFALFGGLIGPAAPFFPANWINQQALLRVTGVPVSLFRALSGVAITYGIVRAFSVVLDEIELWLESVERMQALISERERIGRELHDGIIQSIYASGLMLEGARHDLIDEPEEARRQLTRAIESLNRTIQDIRRYIFDLRGEMPEDDLETGLRKLLKDFRVNTLLETTFSLEGEGARRLDAERRQHVFQIAREALTNVARHARAQRVEVRLQYEADVLQLSISDDGVGLSATPSENGHGLRNIRERTRLLNGVLDIDPTPGDGLTLVLTVPY